MSLNLLPDVFNESVVNGLRYYKIPCWTETAKWVQYNLNLWKIQNVKTTSQGITLIKYGILFTTPTDRHKNVEYQSPC